MEKTVKFENNLDMFKNIVLLYKDYISGWNYLDENSNDIYIVYNPYSEVAVDDFLYAHNTDKSWKDIDYTIVDSTSDINKTLSSIKLSNNEIRAYATLA